MHLWVPFSEKIETLVWYLGILRSRFGAVPSTETVLKIERPNAISETQGISTSLIVCTFCFLEYSPETTIELCMSRRHLENSGRNGGRIVKSYHWFHRKCDLLIFSSDCTWDPTPTLRFLRSDRLIRRIACLLDASFQYMWVSVLLEMISDLSVQQARSLLATGRQKTVHTHRNSSGLPNPNPTTSPTWDRSRHIISLKMSETVVCVCHYPVPLLSGQGYLGL